MEEKKLQRILRGLNHGPLVACGYQQLTVTGISAQSLTIPVGATYCDIRVESATTTGIIMYYTLCASLPTPIPPTTTTGMPLVYLDQFDLINSDSLINFRVIAVSSTHKLNIQYFK